MKKKFFLYVVLSLCMVGCREEKNTPLEIDFTFSEFVYSLQIPNVHKNSVSYELPDNTRGSYITFNKYVFGVKEDTAILEIKNTILNKNWEDTCFSDAIKIFEHTKDVIRVVKMNEDASEFSNQAITFQGGTLYVTFYNNGFYAVSCFDNRYFSLYLNGVKDTSVSHSIINSIRPLSQASAW